ncbi:MAG: hypothetical protein ABSF69_13050 [Polyangiaceae bacterium]|jgi:hypothetical protein
MAAEKTNPSDKKPLTKSDFIRQQPASLSAAEVVAKAKGEGIEFGPGLVYEVRRLGKAKKSAAPPKAAGVAKKTSTGSNGSAAKPAPSKADFVRKFPNLSPKEVVERAKAEGVTFDVGYVYNIRSADRAAQAKRKPSPTKPTAAKPQPAAVSASRAPAPASANATEDLLRAVAAEVGLGRAVEILAGERARVHSILRG